jgi:hypothetical protein
MRPDYGGQPWGPSRGRPLNTTPGLQASSVSHLDLQAACCTQQGQAGHTSRPPRLPGGRQVTGRPFPTAQLCERRAVSETARAQAPVRVLWGMHQHANVAGPAGGGAGVGLAPGKRARRSPPSSSRQLAGRCACAGLRSGESSFACIFAHHALAFAVSFTAQARCEVGATSAASPPA